MIEAHGGIGGQVEDADAAPLDHLGVARPRAAQPPAGGEQGAAAERSCGEAQFEWEQAALGGVFNEERNPEEEDHHSQLDQQVIAAAEPAQSLFQGGRRRGFHPFPSGPLRRLRLPGGHSSLTERLRIRRQFLIGQQILLGQLHNCGLLVFPCRCRCGRRRRCRWQLIRALAQQWPQPGQFLLYLILALLQFVHAATQPAQDCPEHAAAKVPDCAAEQGSAYCKYDIHGYLPEVVNRVFMASL